MTGKPFPTRAVLVISGAAAVVGLGAGIITVAPGIHSNDTSVDDARVDETVEPSQSPRPIPVAAGEGLLAGGLADSIEVADPANLPGGIATTWVVPTDAPLDEFPLELDPDPDRSCLELESGQFDGCMDAAKKCTDAQLQWLEVNAYQTPSNGPEGIWLGIIQFRNAATTGSALTIKDVKPEGGYTEIPGDSFILTCSPYFDGAMGAAATSSVFRPTSVDLSNSNSALFGEPLAFGEDPTSNILAGAPAVLNLAPGQAASLGVLAKAPVEAGVFEGQLVTTIASGSETDSMPITIGGQTSFSIAYASNPGAVLALHGGAMCPEPVEIVTGGMRYNDILTCTLTDFLSEYGLG